MKSRIQASDIKTLGNNKIQGQLVKFTGPDSPDLDGDYFDSSTNFGFTSTHKVPLFYQHGYDSVLNNIQIGEAKLSKSSTGIWLEAQLDIRKDYEEYVSRYLKSPEKIEDFFEAIKSLINKQVLGLSSGALWGLSRYKDVKNISGDTVYHIEQWILGEASLTPNPAEYTNMVEFKSMTNIINQEYLHKTYRRNNNYAIHNKNDIENKKINEQNLLNNLLTTIKTTNKELKRIIN